MTIQNSSTPLSSPQHPPLAHDAQGCKVAVPPGTAHWRIQRFTGGRPKTLLGRFDLELTHDQLLETFGPGKYRIEALDEFGRPLGEIATVQVGLAGEAAPTELAVTQSLRAVPPTTDARFMLETLANMSRAHSESLQSLANAQADWIKTLATAKQIPRNGIMLPQMTASTATEPPEPEPWWAHLLKPPALVALGGVARNLMSFLGPKQDTSESPKRRNSALSQIADRSAVPKQPEAPATSNGDTAKAFELAYQQIFGKQTEQPPKDDEGTPGTEKSS
ncbi:MAG TPA: hypothetical protein VMJ10_26565 [Kofleriaceae bacterium]|nr:hypothetical protein [Kofleriaceae bacterium]